MGLQDHIHIRFKMASVISVKQTPFWGLQPQNFGIAI